MFEHGSLRICEFCTGRGAVCRAPNTLRTICDEEPEMKKLLVLALVFGFGMTAIGCNSGSTGTTKTTKTTTVTPTHKK
jgi:hypothetical protein